MVQPSYATVHIHRTVKARLYELARVTSLVRGVNTPPSHVISGLIVLAGRHSEEFAKIMKDAAH